MDNAERTVYEAVTGELQSRRSGRLRDNINNANVGEEWKVRQGVT